MKRTLMIALVATVTLAAALPTAHAKVTNANPDELPPGCEELAGEEHITVHGGRPFAEQFNGAVFTFDNRSWEVPSCTKLTVTFVNEDQIRHQFMVHGTYPFDMGFFQIEVTGPGEDTGTFITGPDQESLLVHCGVRQHQQKGMKAELLVDGGVGHLPNIPGISGLPDQPVTGGHAHEAAADEHEHAHGASVDEGSDPMPVPSLGAEIVALLATIGLFLRGREP